MVEETPELDETKGMATVGMAMGIGILTRASKLRDCSLRTTLTKFLRAF